MKIGITLYDTVDYLDCTEARIEYLRSALEENDNSFIATALCDIAESLNIKNTEMYVAMISNEADRKIWKKILEDMKGWKNENVIEANL